MELNAPTAQRRTEPGALLRQIASLQSMMAQRQTRSSEALAQVADTFRDSAANLLNYVVLRQQDLRPLQNDLAEFGLSSLGRCESHVADNLDRVTRLLEILTQSTSQAALPGPGNQSRTEGQDLLDSHHAALLGPLPVDRPAHIMVTADTDRLRSEPDLLAELAEAGMDCLRINAAKGTSEDWLAVADQAREVRERCGGPLQIQLDLPGPKIRTGPMPKGIRVRPGDRLRLTAEWQKGWGPDGQHPGLVACSMPALVTRMEPGDQVAFDDARFTAVVEETGSTEALLRVDRARPDKGEKLRGNKGINLPDRDLPVPAFGETERACLTMMRDHVDLVALSYAHDIADIDRLHRCLDDLDLGDCGVVLKIENRLGFQALPDLLLHAMRRPRVGVMVARGDLAAEVGFERLAEVQEEILWLSEAAHVPVIWATEVLDRLAKKGGPARAEITDAATAARAECVMLNKGPHIVRAVGSLADILRRMGDHRSKKTPLLRRLRAWDDNDLPE